MLSLVHKVWFRFCNSDISFDRFAAHVLGTDCKNTFAGRLRGAWKRTQGRMGGSANPIGQCTKLWVITISSSAEVNYRGFKSWSTDENLEKSANRNREYIEKQIERTKEMIDKVVSCSDDLKFWIFADRQIKISPKINIPVGPVTYPIPVGWSCKVKK